VQCHTVMEATIQKYSHPSIFISTAVLILVTMLQQHKLSHIWGGSLSKSCLLQLAPYSQCILLCYILDGLISCWDNLFNRCSDYAEQWCAYLHMCVNRICS
jgi:hypothetical protein